MGVNSSCRSSGLLCPSAFPPLKAVATDWMDCNKELTAAGLHRIHTCFPFNPHSRNESFRGTRLGKDSERRAKKKANSFVFLFRAASYLRRNDKVVKKTSGLNLNPEVNRCNSNILSIIRHRQTTYQSHRTIIRSL